MAKSNVVSETAGSILSKIFSGIIWFGLALLIIGIVGGLMWYFLYYKRKFDIRVLIKSDRSQDKYKIIEDFGAILSDPKTKTKFLRLWNTKFDLPVPPFQILQATNKGDLVELWRKSEDEFVYLLPGTINKKYVVRQDGTKYPVAQTEQIQLEGDIAYWNVKRKGTHKKLFDREHILMKLLPFIPQLLGGVFIIFILYILLDGLPAILSQLGSLIEELRTLKTAEIKTVASIIPILIKNILKRK